MTQGGGSFLVAAPGLALLSLLVGAAFAVSPDAATPDGATAASLAACVGVGVTVVVGVGVGATVVVVVVAASFFSSHATSVVINASAISTRIIAREYCIPPRSSTAPGARAFARLDVIARTYTQLLFTLGDNRVVPSRPETRTMKQLAMIALILFAATTAHADDRDKARAAFRLGSQHYSLGEYKEALAAFKEAYRSYEDSSFLFNIAQCHRQLDQRADAIREYRMYLVNAPDASNREEVRQLITRLERELAEERATKAAPPPGVQPPSVSPATSARLQPSGPPTVAAPSLALTVTATRARETPTYKKWWVWTLVGVAVAGGAAAGLAVGLTRGGGSTPTANTSFGTASPF
jgi:hypothetical protein